jgi:hypothetical protein
VIIAIRLHAKDVDTKGAKKLVLYVIKIFAEMIPNKDTMYRWGWDVSVIIHIVLHVERRALVVTT